MSVFAYFDSDTGATVYHVLPGLESDGSESSMFYSETESEATGTTIQSDELPGKFKWDCGYFVLHHGRQQPASDKVLRWYPSDNIKRYILRYIVNHWLFGGNYVGPVRNILAPAAGRERRALELGTRTGTWIQSMATEFPHVQFRSLDVVPIMAHAPRPNVIFEVYDFTEGILVEDESQDVVFLNMIIEMVKDYRGLVREVHRVLRPGGLIHSCDYIPYLWDSQNPTTPAEDKNPVARHWVGYSQELLSKIGVDPYACNKLPEWLAPGSTLWNNEDVSRSHGFEQIESVVRTHPAYPHPGFPLRDMFGVLKDGGMRDEEVEKLIGDMIEELKQHRN
ncbi:hypothetical protein FRC07_009856, partial [Ceratobasidium sp. 392]